MQNFFFFTLSMLALQATAQSNPASNKHFQHTLTTSASPDKIWSIWTDVPNWKTWDTGLKDASINSPFDLNARGTIRTMENRKSAFKVVALEQGKSYTFQTRLPLGRLLVTRRMEVQKNGTLAFTHEVRFKGLTGGVFARKFGKKFKAMLPEVMENVKKKAENSL